MKPNRKWMCLLLGCLMLYSCSSLPKESSLLAGHAYVYDGKTLYDLAELEYVDPGVIDDYQLPSGEEILYNVKHAPAMFIITFTVVGYTQQTNVGSPSSLDFTDYQLQTNLRVEEIHYKGDEVTINEGETYTFHHSGAWVLEQEGKMVYSIRQPKYHPFGLFKYGNQYIMCGGYSDLTGSLYISNDLGWNEASGAHNLWFLD